MDKLKLGTEPTALDVDLYDAHHENEKWKVVQPFNIKYFNI